MKVAEGLSADSNLTVEIHIDGQRHVRCKKCGGLSKYDPKYKKHLIDESTTNACCWECDIKYRLYKGIDITQEGCWEWKGSKLDNGYGQIKVDGMREYTHRLSWLLHNGYACLKPNGALEDAYGVSYRISNAKYGNSKVMVVRHKCDNPACINPEHLEIGSSSENTQDSISRGGYKKNKDVQAMTLSIIKEHQPISLNAIFDLSEMSKGSIRKAAYRLEGKGAIKVAYTEKSEVTGRGIKYYALPDWVNPNTDLKGGTSNVK